MKSKLTMSAAASGNGVVVQNIGMFVEDNFILLCDLQGKRFCVQY